MQVTLKTLQQQTFKIDIDPEETVCARAGGRGGRVRAAGSARSSRGWAARSSGGSPGGRVEGPESRCRPWPWRRTAEPTLLAWPRALWQEKGEAVAGRRRPGGRWRGAQARAGLGLGARASGAGGGWGGPGRLGSGAWLSGVGAQVGEGDVGVATTHVWTWLGA